MNASIRFLTILLIVSTFPLSAQEILKADNRLTRQDTLRGAITPERVWWDLTHYHLNVTVNPDKKFISGSNLIQYKVLDSQKELQIDLQAPLQITKIIQNGQELQFRDEGNAHFITLKDLQDVGSLQTLEIFYQGHPKEAVRAPWDGGFSWKKDVHGNAFAATSCQGLGASVWWPCKDHMYDEVDSMLISVTVPKGVMDVSNGILRSVNQNPSTTTYTWFVNNPINNYGVNVNIGDYVHFSEVFPGEKGPLHMDYYVLRDHLELAKEHFKDAPKMMKAFEYWFGPYPFYEDGYKLVEVPYLGMEHQSSTTYGNHYMKGYLGTDLSNSGWGLKFDFIIIHESGHEWFANNITYRDMADMWIHESFTAYSENLFVDYYYGKEASADYVIGTRKLITNENPIIGNYYNVNKTSNGTDMYYKGANMLHTLRQLVKDDEKWRQILRGLNKRFYHQTVTTQQIEDFLCEQTGIDLTEFFQQYLRTTDIPTLEYKIENKALKYHWTHIVDKFDMPLQVAINNHEQWLFPTANWKTLPLPSKDASVTVDRDFYVDVNKL